MELLSAALTAFILTTGMVPFTIFLAQKLGLVDDPNKRPHPAHVHKTTLPRAGGIPIYLGIIFACLIFLPIEKSLVGIFAGITILLATGIIDDKVTSFNPYLRLGLLFLAAAAAVGSGIGISFITNPLGGIIRLDQIVIPFDFFGAHKIVLLADLFAFFWIITLTQVINWSKGIDGQMPGITSVAALTLGLLSFRLYSQGDPNQLQVAQLGFITAGASLGFLVFNWHPSKILPGFSGSTILAFMLAVIAILSGAKVATALLVLAIPAADFLYTFCRRILSGRSPVWGDRGHLHHLLLNLGWSHQQISLFYTSGSAMFGAVALLASSEVKVFAILAAGIVLLGFIIWINSFGEQGG